MQGGGTLFEELGFYYVGPIDGHNLEHLLPVLENVRDAAEGPILIHVVTQKGKGYAPAEAAADKYHGVQKFDVVSGTQHKATPTAPAYQNVFGDALIVEAKRDPTIVAITAAMPIGHRRRSLQQGVPGPHVRCRHCRTACRHLRRRPRRAGHAAVLRDLQHLPAARL